MLHVCYTTKNSEMSGKLIILSAPSGTGKTTLVNCLLKKGYKLQFSISATTRAPRGSEQHGREYYFISNEEFENHIANNNFVEWEEVYAGHCYGTLKSEIERIWNSGNDVLFDVDVKGGLRLKSLFGSNALAIFIQPPSLKELEQRLLKRGTDNIQKIDMRLAKASEELQYAEKFDYIVVNENLETATNELQKIIDSFLLQK